MEGMRGEEKRGLLRKESDADSIRSFASSSTLAATPTSPIEDDDKPSFLLEQDGEPSFCTTSLPPQPLPWRKTPLTFRGLTSLLLRLLLPVLLPLLPSFLHPHDPSKPPRRLHATSYLNGLRGVAALVVLHSHFLTNWFYPLRSGYLSSPENQYIMQLPILRLFYAGRASVAIFFVISGFVLSYKPLQLIRKGEQAKVLEVLGSSVFRRNIRLWVPITFGTAIAALLAFNNLYTPVPTRGELIPPIFPTWQEQMWHWYGDLSQCAFPWKGSGVDGNGAAGLVYNGHLWTIPIEFYGSIVVFVTVLGLSGVNRGNGGMRILIGIGLVWYSLAHGRWDVSLFLGGVVLAEWSLITSPSSPGLPFHHRPTSRFPDFEDDNETRIDSLRLVRISKKFFAALSLLCRPAIRKLRPFTGPLNLFLLFVALFLLSYAGESPSPGHFHDFLVPYTPEIWEGVGLGREHFWLCIGALLLLFTLTNSTSLQSPFNSRLAQYLGDVSYSLYIVHGMVLFTLGTGLWERWTGLVGKEQWVDNGMGELVQVVVMAECKSGQWWKALLGCAVLNFVVVFWCADLFWRVVDGRMPRWGRCVEGLVSGKRRSSR
jgi:peptidoglycan/LPS O-acetylase OafA/YrhL